MVPAICSDPSGTTKGSCYVAASYVKMEANMGDNTHKDFNANKAWDVRDNSGNPPYTPETDTWCNIETSKLVVIPDSEVPNALFGKSQQNSEAITKSRLHVFDISSISNETASACKYFESRIVDTVSNLSTRCISPGKQSSTLPSQLENNTPFGRIVHRRKPNRFDRI